VLVANLSDEARFFILARQFTYRVWCVLVINLSEEALFGSETEFASSWNFQNPESDATILQQQRLV
jgi:hypothetical protein